MIVPGHKVNIYPILFDKKNTYSFCFCRNISRLSSCDTAVVLLVFLYRFEYKEGGGALPVLDILVKYVNNFNYEICWVVSIIL